MGRPRYWFALAAVLCVVGFVAFSGDDRSLVEIAAFVVLMAACLRFVGLAVRDDETTSLLVSRRGLSGWMADESPSGRRRRTHRSPERRAR